MVCIGEVLVEESMAMNIHELPNDDETEFGFKVRNKSGICAPDVIFL
jgi:hypothetical protein